MKVLSNFILFSYLFFCASAGLSQLPDHDDSDYYYKGLEYKREGDWAQALQFWFRSGQLLQRQQKSDPRIGVAFIELTTQQKAEKYYDLACEMYFWGFSQETQPEYRKELEKEVDRLAPLLTKDERKRWRTLLNQDLSLLKIELKSFWLKKDPTPSTTINERLLEHWERIAHARKNFKKARNTIYGTDDRGIIYIKYGRPDRIASGTLGGNRAQLKQWTDIISESNTYRRVLDSENSVSATAAEQTFLLQEVDRFNNFPEYEIWFYYSLLSDEPIFFIFGNREGSGLFGLRSGVEEFIPSRAFLKSSTGNTNGILPGAVLQSLYYSQLMHLNPYFEDRYYDLEVVWSMLASERPNNNHVNTTFSLKRNHYLSLDVYAPLHAKAPTDKTNFDKTVSRVDLLVHPFRFLDEKNSSKLALITFSYPKIKTEFINFNTGSVAQNYSTVHTLIVRNNKKEEMRRLTELVPFGRENVSTFILPHVKSQDEYKITAEIFDSPGGVARVNSTHTPERVIGLGEKTIPAITPLSVSRDRLELSDLLIGLNEQSQSESARMHFPIIPSNRIWVGDSLQIYLEIYHLYLDPDGLAHYRIDFEVAELKGKKKSKEQSITLSFNFDSPQRTSRENFKVDVSKLAPGSYELKVSVTDHVSTQGEYRRAFFEIVDREERGAK